MEILILIHVLLIGLCLGSFIALCARRLPQGESIVRPRSHCRGCRASLSWFENLPVLSFALLRGRCRHCRSPIAWTYPATELSTMALTYLAYLKIQPLGHYLLILFTFIVPLWILFWTDLLDLTLPNAITLPGIALGVLVRAVENRYFAFPPADWLGGVGESLIGILAGSLPLLLIAWLYWRWRGQEGLGMGDVKLMAMLGAFLGFRLLPLLLFGASVLGLMLALVLVLRGKFSRQHPLPFGSCLVLSGILVKCFEVDILRWLAPLL